jgi:hypothetical protein
VELFCIKILAAGNIENTRHKTNKRERKSKGQSRMDNTYTLATLRTQDTRRREIKQRNAFASYMLEMTILKHMHMVAFPGLYDKPISNFSYQNYLGGKHSNLRSSNNICLQCNRVLGVSNKPISTILIFDFGTAPTVWYFSFSILLLYLLTRKIL